jgi:hypothetical protein
MDMVLVATGTADMAALGLEDMAVMVMGMEVTDLEVTDLEVTDLEVTDLDRALEGLVHMVLVTVLVDTGLEDSMVLGMVVVLDNLNTPVKRMLSNQPTKLKRKPTPKLNQRTLHPSKPMLRLSQLTRSLSQRIHKLNSLTLNLKLTLSLKLTPNKLMYNSPQLTLKLQLFNNR